MSPLISMLIEAADQVAFSDETAGKSSDDTGGAAGSVANSEGRPPIPATAQPPACRAAVNGAANWDWCTVSVFTCSKACRAGGSGSGSCYADGTMNVLPAAEGAPPQAIAGWVEETVHIVLESDCEMPIGRG